MKDLKLQTVNAKGEVFEESSIKVNEGSILIQQLPEGISYETAEKAHNVLSDAVKNGGNVLTLPYGFQLKTLEIGNSKTKKLYEVIFQPTRKGKYNLFLTVQVEGSFKDEKEAMVEAYDYVEDVFGSSKLNVVSVDELNQVD